jgi:large subunit ribosomal protein L28
MPLTPRPLAVAQSVRAFSTTPAPQKLPKCPPYPYPEARWYKKQNRGLFGGQSIQFGNKVSEEYDRKSRRTWHPNVQNKKLYSVALNQWLRVMTTTRVLRTIDKLGGIDNYLLGDKTTRIKHLGPVGWRLRWKVLNSDYIKSRLRRTGSVMGDPAEIPAEAVLKTQMANAVATEEGSDTVVVAEAAGSQEVITEHDEVLEIEDPVESIQATPDALGNPKAPESSKPAA